MIVQLRGTVAFVDIDADAVVVDVAGVGYRVHVPSSITSTIGPPGAEVTLHTRMRVSDSDITLFGAADREAMLLFDELVSVSGVGPRIGMAMLSTFDAGTIATAIASEDADLLVQTPGVGRKTAQRLVLELKGKVEALALASGPDGTFTTVSRDDDAVEALMALGYSSTEARHAVEASGASDDEPLEERLRAALRWLSG